MNWKLAFNLPDNYIDTNHTYYLSILAVILEVKYYDEEIIALHKPATLGTAIGLDPSNTNKAGYTIDTLIPGVSYLLTSYVYAFKYNRGSNYLYQCIPKHLDDIYYPSLIWRYDEQR